MLVKKNTNCTKVFGISAIYPVVMAQSWHNAMNQFKKRTSVADPFNADPDPVSRLGFL
jgi:hypothetical protein